MKSIISESFETMIKSIAPILSEFGFSRKKHLFYSKPNGNWKIIHFQKSLSSTADVVIFTIELGIASAKLFEFFGRKISGPPKIEDCHWRQRIGFLLPDHKDYWWTIKSWEEASGLIDPLTETLVTLAIPELNALQSDLALRDHWASGNSGGLTEVQRLITLSTLVKAYGPAETLPLLITEMKRLSEGRPYSSTVDLHIKKLANAI